MEVKYQICHPRLDKDRKIGRNVDVLSEKNNYTKPERPFTLMLKL